MNLTNKIAYKISAKNRDKKFNFFMKHFKPTDQTKILDVGVSEYEPVESTNILEKKYPWPQNITGLTSQKLYYFLLRYPKVQAVTYEGTKFPFRDKEFDICWCNAVIEHIGDFNAQLNFIKEITRVSKSAFITTPNRYFPVEIHSRIPLLHYLPKQTFDKILKMARKGYFAGNNMNLLSKRQIVRLLNEANIRNYKIIKNRFILFTMEYLIVINWKN